MFNPAAHDPHCQALHELTNAAHASAIGSMLIAGVVDVRATECTT
jgi:hypothetical protein